MHLPLHRQPGSSSAQLDRPTHPGGLLAPALPKLEKLMKPTRGVTSNWSPATAAVETAISASCSAVGSMLTAQSPKK